jgi:hypothetical protein
MPDTRLCVSLRSATGKRSGSQGNYSESTEPGLKYLKA